MSVASFAQMGLKPQLPVNRTAPLEMGATLKALSIEVAALQDRGAPASEWKPKIIEYYKRMRAICPAFREVRMKSEPDYWHTLCRSGANGTTLRRGEQCVNCEAMSSETLYQIIEQSKLAAEAAHAA